jgi:peptidoglycan/LPS O-acetylase OafA/YrhL
MNFLPIRPDIKNLQLIALGFIVAWGLSGNTAFLAGFPLFFALVGYGMTQHIREAKNRGETYNPIKGVLNTVWGFFSEMHLVALLVSLWVITRSAEVKEIWLESAFNMSLGVGNFAQLDRPDNYFSPDSLLSPFVHLWAMSVAVQFALVLVVIGFLLSLLKFDVPVLVSRVLVLVLLCLGIYLAISFQTTLAIDFLDTRTWIWAVLIGIALGFTDIRFPESRTNALAGDVIFFSTLVVLTLAIANITLFEKYNNYLILFLLVTPVLFARNETFHFQLLVASVTNKLSYVAFGTFLWHWPLAQLAKNQLGVEVLPLLQILGLLVLSMVLGFITTQFIEYISAKLAKVGELRQGVSKLAALAVLPLALFFLQNPATNNTTPEPKETITFSPLLSSVASDVPDYFNNPNCTKNSTDCIYGDPTSDTHVILYGSSLSGNWQPALAEIAIDESWKLEVRINENCPDIEKSKKCDAWLKKTKQYILSVKPDLVISNFALLGTRATALPNGDIRPGGNIEEVMNAEIATWIEFFEADIRVASLRGSTHYEGDPIECLKANPTSIEACAFSREAKYITPAELERYTALIRQNINLIDVTNSFCLQDRCDAATSKGLVIYRDSTHVTKTFMLTLVESLRTPLVDLLSKPVSNRPNNCLPNDQRPECS